MKSTRIILFLVTLSPLMVHSQAIKRVLVEEGTGTWCQWCTRGEVYAKEIHKQFPAEAVFISVHGGSSSEPMNMPDYIDSLGISSFPSGKIDRVGQSSMHPSGISSDVNSRLGNPAMADVDIVPDYEPSSRLLSATIFITPDQQLTGNYGVGLIVLESGITGPSPAYDQSNAYSGGNNGVMGGFENLPSPVPASYMSYNHVPRKLLGGFSGSSDSLPNPLDSGTTYRHTFSWTVPTDFNADYMTVVGVFVDKNSGEVRNANISTYIDGSTNAKPFFHSNAKTQGYRDQQYEYEVVAHDPDHDAVQITIGQGPSWLSLIDKREGVSVLSGIPMALGSFDVTLELSDGNSTVQQVFTIVVDEPIEDWVQVGNPGFCDEATPFFVDIEFDGSGIPYVLTANSDEDEAELYKLVDDQWQKLGKNVKNISAFNIDLAVSSSGDVFVISEGDVSQLDGNNWDDLGNIGLEHGNQIVVDNGGVIHAVGFNSGTLPEGVKYDGSDWVMTSPIGDDFMVWPRLKVSTDGIPIVIYGNGGPWSFNSEVAIFDGTSWNVIGGGAIESSSTTAFDHDVAADANGIIYAAIPLNSSNNINVYEFDGVLWKVHTTDLNIGAVDDVSLDIDKDGNLFVSFKDLDNGNRLSVKKFDGTEWRNLGIPGFTPGIGAHQMTIRDGNDPWVVYSDNAQNEKVSAKRYQDFALLDIGEPGFRSLVEVYPNPSTGVVHLTADQPVEYAVKDNTGRMILKGVLGREIDLSEFPVGIYSIVFSAGDSFQVEKLILTH